MYTYNALRSAAKLASGSKTRPMTHSFRSDTLGSHNDVVDGDVDQLDEEPDEPHDGKPNRRRYGNLLELFSVWLGALFDQANGVLGELTGWVHELHHLIHSVFLV
eukprot:TRINITY_DN77220_c0_g1_i2.p1 TRINITY_DN77220_c0_g1~~TRINITY_DN77220_c0_g1_i2.p1  ORF type:complete len:105 (+),score=10.21 TRINITY_DN77220_c0_g1_i2:317-631(+)